MTPVSDTQAEQALSTEHFPLTDRKSLARAITTVENNLIGCEAIIEQAEKHIGQAHVIGFTGPPGVGKSTLINACITEIRQSGKSIAVVAVDPSSEISGGAILGDRLRMTAHANDDQVFIRSVAARGQLGGVSAATVNIINLFDTAGWDIIIVETVGTGQSEIDISKIADTTVVIQSPGFGDGIQAIKAGLLEMADILVVNKSDLPDADRVVGELKLAVSLRHTNRNSVILKTSATDQSGISELLQSVKNHRKVLQQSSAFIPGAARMRYVSINVITKMLEHGLRDFDGQSLDQLRRLILSGEVDATTIASSILQAPPAVEKLVKRG